MGNTCIILQVRLSSTRLPRKLLLPLSGTSIFEHILQRLSAAHYPDGIIVATTADTAPYLGQTAAEYNAPVVVGSESDVLGRYITALEKFSVDTVIRATGDNPLVCIEYIDRALLLHRSRTADLTAYPELPYGTGIEVIESEALRNADEWAKTIYEREHITSYLYAHENRFTVVREVPDEPFHRPEVRLTVDTREDYVRMKRIYDALYKGHPILLRDVLSYLDTQGV